MKNCLIIGSGRSGTSMLGGVLHEAGYYMGESLYPPNISNLKGFFESSITNSINEKILSNYQTDERFNRDRFQRWLIIIKKNVAVKCEEEEVLNQIREETSKSLPFCYKDPRFSYTLPVWEPFLPEDKKFLCIFRKPQNTMQSIIKECANSDYLDDFYINEEYAYSVWEHIYHRILNYDYKIQKNIIYIHYDQILKGEAVNLLSDLLEVDLNKSFPDIKLNRTNINLEDIPEKCIDIYNELCQRANFEEKLVYKQPAKDEKIEILENRIKNKEKSLQKKSVLLRQRETQHQQSLQRVICLNNKLQTAKEVKNVLLKKGQVLGRNKRVLENEKTKLLIDKKHLEDLLSKVYSSYTWKTGIMFTRFPSILLDLLFIKELNKGKGFIFIRIYRYCKKYFKSNKTVKRKIELLQRSFLKIKVFFGVYPKYKLSKKQFEFVIARYDEDINWTKALKSNRTIYNKGSDLDDIDCIKLQNVGRESHTYLWHITKNYDHLADITLFSQGSINEDTFNIKWLKKGSGWERRLVKDTVLSCRLLKNNILFTTPFIETSVRGLDKQNRIKFFGKWLNELKSGRMKDSEYDFKSWMDKFVFTRHKFHVKQIKWSPHALFYVNKDLIRSNPKEYYESLLSFVDNHINPMEGHYFERAWFHIFTRSYYKKISICTTCMNRLEHLKDTYLVNIKEGVRYPNIEFVLLNYNSKDGMDNWVKVNLHEYIQKGLVKYYTTRESDTFQMSRAKNMVGRLASGDIVTWVDADNYLSSELLFDVNSKFIINEHILVKPELGKEDNWDLGGQIYVNKSHFENVKGYDESFIGWGYEDLDFADRMCLKNHLYLQYLDNNKLISKKAIAHDEYKRLANYDVYDQSNIYQYVVANEIDIDVIKDKWWFKNISRHTTNELNRIVSKKNIQNKNYVANKNVDWGKCNDLLDSSSVRGV